MRLTTSIYGITSEISLEHSQDVGVSAVLGGVKNHIKVVMLHPLEDQRGPFIEGP